MNLEPTSPAPTEKYNGTRKPLAHAFKKGVSGNPAGRPKGSRNLLGQKFVDDVYQIWQERGPECLRWMAENDPSALVRVVANILPQKFEQDVNIGVKIVRLPEHLNPAELEALYHQPKTIEHQTKDPSNGNPE